MWTVRGTIRGDPQETLCRIRSPILFVRWFILSRCNNNEAEMSIWVMGPSSGKEQQCGGDPKLSRHRVVDTHTCVQRAHKGMGQRTGRSIRDQRCKELTPLLDGFSTLEAFLGPKGAQIINKTRGCFWMLSFASLTRGRTCRAENERWAVPRGAQWARE